MSIETIQGVFHASCDFCSHTEEFDPKEEGLERSEAWGGLMAHLRRAGWLMRKWGTIWKHTCPHCIEKENKSI